MIYIVVLVAVLTRFIPHLPNFSPVFAALLFGGAQLKRRDAIWYPVALLGASDIALTTTLYHMHVGWGQTITWAGFATVSLIGYRLRKHETVSRIGVAAVVGPTAFFIISNFGVWFAGHMYPSSWSGLTMCYLAALPFYKNSLLATVVYSALLFGGHDIYRRRIVEPRTAAQAG